MFNIIFFGQDQEHYDLPSTLLGKSEVINVLNCKEAEELYTLYTLYKSNEIHLILWKCGITQSSVSISFNHYRLYG